MCLPFFLSVCPQGLLLLQLCGYRCKAASAQTQRQQDPHRGLGKDPPHDRQRWSPHGQELKKTKKKTSTQMLHWHERGPRSAAPLYSSTAPYYLVVHSDTGISGLHV